MSWLSLSFRQGRWPVRGGELVDVRRLTTLERERAGSFLERLPSQVVAEQYLSSGGMRLPANSELLEIARHLHLPEHLTKDAHAVVEEIQRAVRTGKLVLLRRRQYVGGRSLAEERSEDEAPVAQTPSEGLGTFVLQYEVDDLATWYETKVTLAADDGGYSSEWHLAAAEDGSHPPSRFVFGRLPIKAKYSLRLQEVDGTSRFLFQGVPYEELPRSKSLHHLPDMET